MPKSMRNNWKAKKLQFPPGIQDIFSERASKQGLGKSLDGLETIWENVKSLVDSGRLARTPQRILERHKAQSNRAREGITNKINTYIRLIREGGFITKQANDAIKCLEDLRLEVIQKNVYVVNSCSPGAEAENPPGRPGERVQIIRSDSRHREGSRSRSRSESEPPVMDLFDEGEVWEEQ